MDNSYYNFLVIAIIIASIIIIACWLHEIYGYIKKRNTDSINDDNNIETMETATTKSLMITCPACGAEISRNAPACIKCGQPICSANSATQTVVVQTSGSNGAGTAGFVLSLISLVFSWVPGVGWFIWFLGFLLSFIGMFKSPRTLAVFGFFISIIDFIILIALVGTIAGALASISN